MHRATRAPSPAVGAVLTAACMSLTLMSSHRRRLMAGARYLRHSRAWVSACLRDHGLSAGCRAGDRYQPISAEPGSSIFGASQASRSDTLTSFAASPASVTDSHSRRRPPSDHTARHRPPSSRAGYTVIPPATSTTTPWPRVAARDEPLTRSDERQEDCAEALPEARALAFAGRGCGDLGIRKRCRRHDVCSLPAIYAGERAALRPEKEWSGAGSNCRPSAFQADAH